jgi:putative membrane protein
MMLVSAEGKSKADWQREIEHAHENLERGFAQIYKENRMNKFTATAALLMVSSSAFAQTATESSGINLAVGVAPKTQDFVTEAAGTDMFEIRSSKLAVKRADPATKSFAQQMITDHTKTSVEIKQMLAAEKATAATPKKMTSDQQSMLHSLRALHGNQFNKEYISDQIAAHKQAVDLFKRYADGGDDAQMKAWAVKTRPVLEHHLMMAQNLGK